MRSDTSTQGNWVSLYGGHGYSVVGGTTNLPSFASVVTSGQSNWTWSASTTDPRAPLTSSAAGAGRVAAAWYSYASFTVDVNLTDGVTHQVALYALDWDLNGRSERVDAVDPANGSVLDSRTVSSFANGQYLVYNVTGHVQFRITTVAGPNAVLSGLFFGGTPPPPTPTVTPTATPRPTATPTPRPTATPIPTVTPTATPRPTATPTPRPTPTANPNPDLATVTLTPGWATFGQVLPEGDLSDGLQLGNLATQTDVKTTWPDGSIKFAIVSAYVPTAGTYTLKSASPLAGSFTASYPSAEVRLLIGGTTYTAALPQAKSADTWLAGPLVNEFRSVVTPVDSSGHPQPYLQVVFDTRSYQGGGNRLDVTVQNVQNIAGATAVSYSVDIVVNGQTRYHHDTLTQYYMTRWRQVLDVGITESAVTPDLSTVIQAGALPQYDTSVISNVVDSPSGASYDILGIGGLPYNDMSSPGEDVRTTLYPDWVPVYLTYKNPTELAVILKNGDLAGSWPMHLNQSDGNPMNIDQNPMFWMDPRGGQWGTEGVAGDWNSRGPLNPEVAHTPSLAFVPYLITGDRYYVDEMKDWAAWGLANGNPGYRGGSEGLLGPGLIQVRALAWQLRNIADAAAYLPENDPFRTYFANKVQSNLHWMDDQAVNDLGPLGSFLTQHNENGFLVPVWEYAYLAWSIEHANDLAIPGVSGGYTAETQMAQFALQILNAPSMATNTYPLGWVYVSDSSGVYYTTVAQLIQANGLPQTSGANYYGPHNIVLLRIAIRDTLPGAQAIYNKIYPSALPVIKTRPAFAIEIRVG